MLAHIDLHLRMQRQHHHLARRITRDGHAARSLGGCDHERHAPKAAAARVHRRHHDILLLPQQHVVLEVHRVARAQVQLGDWHDLALHLTTGAVEVELGHVLQAWRFAPPRIRDQCRCVERCATHLACSTAGVALPLTPRTDDSFHRVPRFRLAQ